MKNPPLKTLRDKALAFNGRFIAPIWAGRESIVADWSLNQRLIAAGVAVGSAAGFAAWLFDRAIVVLSADGIARVEKLGFASRAAWLLLLPAAGAFISAALVRRFCLEAGGHGVNEVYKAIKERDGRIPGRVALIKLLASASTIGLGGSAGREGPVIQIGASVGSWIGQKFNVSPKSLKTLSAAGACAGLGTSFGAPLAAVFFTMEVLLRDFANESFSAVVIASVSGVVTASALMGGSVRIAPLTYSWHRPEELVLYAFLGLLCAPFGVLYMRCLGAVERWAEFQKRIPGWLTPALGGIAVGLIALFLPEVMGTGQATINAALNGGLLTWRAGALTLGKIAATSMTLGMGGSGGAFMPAIFIGSAAGSAWAALLHSCFALPAQYAGAFAVVGMAAVVASSYRAPVTAIILALEMSRDYGILMPVMLACVVGHLITRAQKTPPIIEQ